LGAGHESYRDQAAREREAFQQGQIIEVAHIEALMESAFDAPGGAIELEPGESVEADDAPVGIELVKEGVTGLRRDQSADYADS